MDITNRAGTITYHIKPTDRVRMKRQRIWCFVREASGVLGSSYKTVLLYRNYEDAQARNVRREKMCSCEFFCQNVAEIKPSLEKEAL